MSLPSYKLSRDRAGVWWADGALPSGRSFHIDCGRAGDIAFYPNTINAGANWTDLSSIKLAPPFDYVDQWRRRTNAGMSKCVMGHFEEITLLRVNLFGFARAHAEGSCVEADTMVELAQNLPGLIGARLTGGGFGGCTVNLVEQNQAQAFAKALGERYAAKTGIEPQIHVCHASDGAHRLE